jgi:hemerythrin
MSEIIWDDSLSVGIDLIDEQHKKLIKRLGNLSQAVKSNQAVGEILKTLDFLVEYTDYHFSTEEKHMSELQYPGFNEHKAQHEQFKGSLKNLIDDFEEEGATSALSTAINVFLMNWLVDHIKSVDVEFGIYLKDKDKENIGGE